MVLQALYNFATHGTTKVSYAEAKAAVERSVTAHRAVGTDIGGGGGGVSVQVWFDQPSFDPSKFDARFGGAGTCETIVEGLRRQLVDTEDSRFLESNRMHGINGMVYCNSPHLRMTEGENVRWYVLVAGTEKDVHTPHWHGNVLNMTGRHVDEAEMLPGSSLTLDMTADNPGSWMYVSFL